MEQLDNHFVQQNKTLPSSKNQTNSIMQFFSFNLQNTFFLAKNVFIDFAYWKSI